MKKIHLSFLSMITASVLFFSISCSKDKDSGSNQTLDCSTVTNKAFAANISPLIQPVAPFQAAMHLAVLMGQGP